MPSEMNGEIQDADFAIGLHVPGTFHKVLDIDGCMLQPKFGNQLLRDVREFIKTSGISAYDLRNHTGCFRFLMLRHSVYADQWMVNLITSEHDHTLLKRLSDQLQNYSSVVSIVNNITQKKSSVAIGEYEVLLFGQPNLKEAIGQFVFEISANSFFQTNTLGAQKLYDVVKNYAELTGTEYVVDLYCGTGTISIWLSSLARKITGIELIESAVLDAKKNCALNGIDNCEFVLGDIRDRLSLIDQLPDVVIIDPPRTGMHPDVTQALLDMAPKRIVYVSCNPATLARDLHELKKKYDIIEVQPVDLFPNTAHIEAVAKLIVSS
ncbi:MAG: 23S rRNA (uracil(1939)-C(5))-methyltransferase RlmD, partial [Desulfobacterales bacterium]|nr:23S rRNA (uracil(1939)-C(5))-methyltransferase RlmD [Desulfobacterales bacterium]